MQSSITRLSSKPVQVCPLYINQLPITRQGLTPFTFTRFLVPWLCNYQGWALFTDPDMMVTADLSELFSYADDQFDLMVIKNPQRFEWASIILFNCAKCTTLTPEYIQDAPPADLFDMNWRSDVEVGELPLEWNHLVGYSPQRDDAKLVHYTQGSPMFPEIGACEYSAEWLREHINLNAFRTWQEIMGTSVHATWLSGKQVPKLMVTDKLLKAELILNSQPSIIEPNLSEPYSRHNTSISYQRRVHKFLKRHIFGDTANQTPIQQTDTGTNILNVSQHLKQFIADKNVATLLDYGAGKTQQYGPITIDTPNGQQQTLFKELLNIRDISCYDPAYPPITDVPSEGADCVVCCDVLDRCPEEDLPWILSEILSLATKCVFIKVSNCDNSGVLEGGEPEICTLKPKDWWVNSLSTAKSQYPNVVINCVLQIDINGNAEDISALIE